MEFHLRALLEILKFLSAFEVLQVSLASKAWLFASNQDEVWLHLLSALHSHPNQQIPKEQYKQVISEFVVTVEKSTVHKFYPGLRQWKRTKLGLKLGPTPSTILLDKQLLFCCYCGEHPGTLIINLKNGRARRTAEMHTVRERPGMCVLNEQIYTFCGAVEGQATSICERFSLRSEEWEVLPRALRERTHFNPAIHQSLIYLSGGGSGSIETFDTTALSFALLPVNCFNVKPVASIIIQDVLYVLNYAVCFWWNCKTRERGLKYPSVDVGSSSQFTPLVWGNSGIFVLFWKGSWEICKVEFDLMRLEVLGTKYSV